MVASARRARCELPPPQKQKHECFQHQVAKTGRPFAAATAASAGFAKAVSFRVLAELLRRYAGPADARGLKAFGFGVSCPTSRLNQNPTDWTRHNTSRLVRQILGASSLSTFVGGLLCASEKEISNRNLVAPVLTAPPASSTARELWTGTESSCAHAHAIP